MEEKKENEYKFPSRVQLKKDWKDFLNDSEWMSLFNEANSINGDDWVISRAFLEKFKEKYEVPKEIFTTGTNVNFDDSFKNISITTFNKKLNLQQFKDLCLKAIIILKGGLEVTYRLQNPTNHHK